MCIAMTTVTTPRSGRGQERNNSTYSWRTRETGTNGERTRVSREYTSRWTGFTTRCKRFARNARNSAKCRKRSNHRKKTTSRTTTIIIYTLHVRFRQFMARVEFNHSQFIRRSQIYIHVDEICTHKPNCSYVNRCTSN